MPLILFKKQIISRNQSKKYLLKINLVELNRIKIIMRFSKKVQRETDFLTNIKFSNI